MVRRPNYIAMRSWGRQPDWPERRRQARRVVYLRSLVYLITVLIAVAYFVDLSSGPAGQNMGVIYGIAMSVGALFCLVAPLQTEKSFSNARILQANWHDWRLAGFSGSEMLRGIAAPQLAGVKFFAKVYVGFMAFWIIGFAVIKPDTFMMLPVTAILLVPILLNLIAGTYVNLALWIKYKNRATRSIVTAIFVLADPIALALLFVPIVWVYNFIAPLAVPLVLFAAFPGIPIKVAVAVSLWDQAREILDGVREQPWRWDEDEEKKEAEREEVAGGR